MKIKGKRSYFGAAVMIALGALLLLGVAFKESGAFDSGQDVVKQVIGWLLILQGVTLIFIRLAISEIKSMLVEVKSLLRDGNEDRS